MTGLSGKTCPRLHPVREVSSFFLCVGPFRVSQDQAEDLETMHVLGLRFFASETCARSKPVHVKDTGHTDPGDKDGDNDNDNDTLREVPHPSNEGLALQARVSGS